MERIITVLTVAAIVIWSLLSLGAWAIFSLGGDLVHSQLDWIFFGNPDVVPVASAVFRFFQNLGIGLVIFVWGLGSLTLWFIGTVIRHLIRSVSFVPPSPPGWTDPDDFELPMKDVTPRPARALPRD